LVDAYPGIHWNSLAAFENGMGTLLAFEKGDELSTGFETL